jgi:hypothetical protein
MNLWLELDNWTWLERCTGAAEPQESGSFLPMGLYIVAFSQLFLVSLDKRIYKFPLGNFHLQDPSTIIQSSEMPTKS